MSVGVEGSPQRSRRGYIIIKVCSLIKKGMSHQSKVAGTVGPSINDKTWTELGSQFTLPVNWAQDGIRHNFPAGRSSRSHTEHGMHERSHENFQFCHCLQWQSKNCEPRAESEGVRAGWWPVSGMMLSLAPLEFVGPGSNGGAGSFLLRQRFSSCFAVVEHLYGLWSHHLVCGWRMERDIWEGFYDEGRKILWWTAGSKWPCFSTVSGQELRGFWAEVSSLVFRPQVGVCLKHVLGGVFPESLKSMSLLNEQAVSAFSQSLHPQNTLLTVDWNSLLEQKWPDPHTCWTVTSTPPSTPCWSCNP